MRLGRLFLITVALIAVLTAIAHLSCIWLGPQCFEAQYAPEAIIESARQGSLLAPVGTILVSLIFILIACYALSATRLMSKLPFLKMVTYGIAALCIIRGLLAIQLWIRIPERVDNINLSIAVVWLISGLFLSVGFLLEDRHRQKP